MTQCLPGSPLRTTFNPTGSVFNFTYPQVEASFEAQLLQRLQALSGYTPPQYSAFNYNQGLPFLPATNLYAANATPVVNNNYTLQPPPQKKLPPSPLAVRHSYSGSPVMDKRPSPSRNSDSLNYSSQQNLFQPTQGLSVQTQNLQGQSSQNLSQNIQPQAQSSQNLQNMTNQNMQSQSLQNQNLQSQSLQTQSLQNQNLQSQSMQNLQNYQQNLQQSQPNYQSNYQQHSPNYSQSSYQQSQQGFQPSPNYQQNYQQQNYQQSQNYQQPQQSYQQSQQNYQQQNDKISQTQQNQLKELDPRNSLGRQSFPRQSPQVSPQGTRKENPYIKPLSQMGALTTTDVDGRVRVIVPVPSAEEEASMMSSLRLSDDYRPPNIPTITRSTSEKVPNRSELMSQVQRTAWARHTTK